METPPSQAPSNYPRPNLDFDRQSLREVAVAQRQVAYCVVIWLSAALLNGVARAGHIALLSGLVALVVLCVWILAIFSAYKLAKALQDAPVVYTILMFIPCVNIVMLLVLSGKATSRLRAAGINVGLMGADPNSIDLAGPMALWIALLQPNLGPAVLLGDPRLIVENALPRVIER